MAELTIDDFLEVVVADACSLLQITEPGGSAFVTTDPRVLICARLAYTQITNYLNRNIMNDTQYEEYFDEDTLINLRCYPVDRVRTVKIIDNRYSDVLTDPDQFTTLSATTDYRLIRNKRLEIYNLDTISEALSEFTSQFNAINVYVEYDGGWNSSDEEPLIHNALVTQTVANYNRIPALGLTQVEGGGSNVRGGRVLMNLNLVDAGELLDVVKMSLSPFVYYGSAEPI